MCLQLTAQCGIFIGKGTLCDPSPLSKANPHSTMKLDIPVSKMVQVYPPLCLHLSPPKHPVYIILCTSAIRFALSVSQVCGKSAGQYLWLVWVSGCPIGCCKGEWLCGKQLHILLCSCSLFSLTPAPQPPLPPPPKNTHKVKASCCVLSGRGNIV